VQQISSQLKTGSLRGHPLDTCQLKLTAFKIEHQIPLDLKCGGLNMSKRYVED